MVYYFKGFIYNFCILLKGVFIDYYVIIILVYNICFNIIVWIVKLVYCYYILYNLVFDLNRYVLGEYWSRVIYCC